MRQAFVAAILFGLLLPGAAPLAGQVAPALVPGAAPVSALLDLVVEGGQTAPTLAPGSRVRVEAPAVHGGALIGQIEALDAASLRVQLQTGGVITVPRDAIVRIDTSEGRRPNKLRGAVIGGCVGLVGGLVVAAQSREEDDRSFSPGFDRSVEVIGTLTLAGVGAGLGTLVGAMIRTERWQEVQLPVPSMRLGLAPTRTGGANIVVTLPR